jgi:hypothetical protein
MLEPEEVRPARPLGRRLLVGVAGGVALLIVADVLRWMWIGPVPLLGLGRLLPPGADLEAEVALGALAFTVALVADGGLQRRFGPPVAVASLALAALLSNLGPFPTGDTAPATLLPFALVREGRLTFEGTGLDQPLLPISAEPLPYFLVRSGERIASKYSPAMGVLATPVYLPAALGQFDARSSAEVEHLGKLAAAILAALGVACVYLASSRLVGQRFAAAATVLYVLGTPVLSVLGQTLWLHTGAALGFSLALVVLTGSDETPWRVGTILGLGVGLALACRPVDVVLAAGFAAALWQVRPRALKWMVPTAAIPVLLLAAYQWSVFGSPLATGYGSEASEGWTTPIWHGVLGLLFSPGRGLLLHAPVLLLSVFALIRAGRGYSPRWFLPLGLSLVAFLFLMGHWHSWWGGSSAGNRMLSDGLPILGAALAFGLREAWPRRRLRAPVVALAAVSIATSAALTFSVHEPLWVQVMSVGGEDNPRPWSAGTHPLVARFKLLFPPSGAARR